MVLVRKIPEGIKWRLEFGKGGLESRGLIVNVRNTEMMIVSENVGKRELMTAILISSCHWETLVPFYVQQKRPENAFVTLQWIIAKSHRKTNYAIQNNNKSAI